jgi:hypothetical protein
MIINYIPAPDPLAALPLQYINELSQHQLPCVLFDFNRGHLLVNVEELLIEEYSKYQTNPPLLVIHSIGEAPTIDNFSFLQPLKSLHPDLNILHITTGWEPPQSEYTTITNCMTFSWPIQGLWKDSFSYQATHHFIALARTPRSSRTRVINSILNKNLQQWGYFSIGTGREYQHNVDYYYSLNRESLGIDEHNLKYFPYYLDGVISQTLEKQYSLEHPTLKNALVNLAIESSFERLTDLPDDRAWTVPMMTEKTVKAFALGQIPLILGPSGQVEKTRQLGFDLFDDLIDQSYDNEKDPLIRIEKYVTSLEQFVNTHPTSTLQSLKDSLMPRFKFNVELLTKLSHSGQVHPEITKFLDRILIKNRWTI